MGRIGEIRKKRVEVGVEIRKFAKRREGLGNAIAPPMPLETAQLVGPQPEPEGEAGSFTESAAKTGGDGVLGEVEAELPRDAGVAASDRFARLEQSAGGVEECSADQEMGTVTEFRLSTATQPSLPTEDCDEPTRKCRRARRTRADRFSAARPAPKNRPRAFCLLAASKKNPNRSLQPVPDLDQDAEG